MIIQTDKEGRQAIEALCDAALKLNGTTSFNFVAKVMSCIKPLEEPKDKEDGE